MTIDPMSSGAFFDGWKTVEATLQAGWEQPVAAARFWLLTTGWRRQGAIGEREVPGGRQAG